MTRNGSVGSDSPMVKEWAGRTISNRQELRQYMKAFKQEVRRRTNELHLGFSPYRSAHIPDVE